jgi:hypothetical protein
VANEYMLRDRPIVFLDVPELLATAAAEDSRLDLDTWGRRAGEVVRGPESVVDAVERALGEPSRYADVRAEIVRDLFFNPGAATSAAMGWLREHVLT